MLHGVHVSVHSHFLKWSSIYLLVLQCLFLNVVLKCFSSLFVLTPPCDQDSVFGFLSEWRNGLLGARHSWETKAQACVWAFRSELWWSQEILLLRRFHRQQWVQLCWAAADDTVSLLWGYCVIRPAASFDTDQWINWAFAVCFTHILQTFFFLFGRCNIPKHEWKTCFL